MDEVCPICLASTKAAVRQLNPCGHTFHRTCVQRWLARAHTCPVCRAHVATPDGSLARFRVLPPAWAKAPGSWVKWAWSATPTRDGLVIRGPLCRARTIPTRSIAHVNRCGPRLVRVAHPTSDDKRAGTLLECRDAKSLFEAIKAMFHMELESEV